MKELMNNLADWGCDTKGALERFMEDEELYRECLGIMAEDPNYEALGAALKAGEVQEAFDYAHTLKGVLANLGLTPLYDIVVRIVEPLRAKKSENLWEIYEELIAANEAFKQMLNGGRTEA